MHFAAAISEHPIAAMAVGEVAGHVLEHSIGEIDLLFVFVSTSHTGALEDIVPALRQLLRPKVMVGCLARGVIGPRQEVIDSPALAVWTASGCEAMAVYLSNSSDEKSHNELNAGLIEGSTVVMFADPKTYAPDSFFARLDQENKSISVVGGYVSGTSTFASNRLIYQGDLMDGGAVAVLIKALDDTKLSTAATQGARPIGSPLVVTRSSGRVIYELAGAPALIQLAEILKTEIDESLGLIETDLLLGRVVDERQEDFRMGDFVVRNLVDSSPIDGSITLSDIFTVGSIVQFQVRDKHAAQLSLTKTLTGKRAKGALLFSSIFRNREIFDQPNNDAISASELLDNPSLAGFMTAGEFAPISNVNVVNGLSTALALFSRPYG